MVYPFQNAVSDKPADHSRDAKPCKRDLLFTALFALTCQVGTNAFAQSLPGSVEPGQIERQFQPQEQPLSGGAGIATPEREGVEAPEGAEAATFILKGLVIEGATVFGEDDLLPLYRDRLGGQVSVKTLYDIAAAITAKYMAAGYLLSQAVVPPQRINGDGIARLRVIEGYVDRVIIRGEVRGPESLLRAYGDAIRAERPLRLKTLERYLLLASDLPGAAVSGTLMPSETPGAADLVFELRHKSIDAAASLDNHGSRYIGPWQSVFGANLNSVAGMYERTSLLYATTPFQVEELKYGRLSHEQIVGDEGTKVSADVGRVASHPGYTLKEMAVRSRSTLLGVGVSHPLIRSRAENLTLRGRFDVRNASTDQNVDETVSKDAIRALRLGGSYDWVDTWAPAPAITLVSLEVSQGLDVLGARTTGSDNLSVTGGHSDFLKTTLEITRTQRLDERFSLVAGISGQWAGSTLLSPEQFSLGGTQFGRGYDPAEITGDHGLAGKLELHYAGPEIPGIKTWRTYGFWDAGRVWQANSRDGAAATRDLAAAGLGLILQVNDNASFAAELARPLTRRISSVGEDNGKDLRGFLGLTIRY